MKYLVGYTGFVGSNIAKEGDFDGLFNSKNIEESYGKNPDLLVYSGVPAAKFIANQNPEKDMEIIENAKKNIEKINPKKIVLISTIDVYKNPNEVDEDSVIDLEDLHPYGYDRFLLEEWVRDNYKDHLVVRLPALYGDNLKKNFIFDMINIIPTMLKKEKFDELSSKSELIKNSYYKQDETFYHVNEDIEDKETLKEEFLRVGFSSLNFTDSRASYQFYNLENLWKHINVALENNIKLLNLATEPVTSNEVYKKVYNEEFTNEITNNVPHYDYRTKYYELFDGNDGYIYDKEYVLEDIKKYVYKHK